MWGRLNSRVLERADESYLSGLIWHHIVELADVSPGSVVLDVGCGWGRITAEVLSGGFEEVYGTDITIELLQRAKARFPMWRKIVQSDARNLPLSSECVDLAFASRVLQYFEDPREPLREMSRVTRRGGRVAIVQPNPLSPVRWVGYHTLLLPARRVRAWMEELRFTDLKVRYFGFLPRGFGSVTADAVFTRLPGLCRVGAYYCVCGRV